MKRSERIIPPLAAALLACTLTSTSPALAQATQPSPILDQDRTAYDALYKTKLASVNRTRTTSDDRALAREMLAFAKDIPDDLGVQCLLYIESVSLASKASDLGLMSQAYILLNERWPEQDAVSPEELMQLASLAYRSAERADRKEQGEHYISLLRSIADHYEHQNDQTQALGICRLASTIARTIDSPQNKPINQSIKKLNDTIEADRRIKMLKVAVDNDPGNSPVAKNLVNLLITRHNDPASALAYVGATQDEELIDLITHCSRGIEQANAATAMRIADWYLGLSDDEPDNVALTLLEQARRWYARFAEQYRREDALATRVAEMDRLTQAKIDRIIAEQTGLTQGSANGWESLIQPPYDPQDFKTSAGQINRDQQGGLTFNKAKFFVPFKKANAFEIRLTLTVHEDAKKDQAPAIRLYLPLGDRVLATRYFIGGERIAEVEKVKQTVLISPAPGQVGQKCDLTVQVAMDGQQVAFAMLYDGKLAVTWQGELNELEPYDLQSIDKQEIDVGHAMYLASPAHVTLHALEYRPHQ